MDFFPNKRLAREFSLQLYICQLQAVVASTANVKLAEEERERERLAAEQRDSDRDKEVGGCDENVLARARIR